MTLSEFDVLGEEISDEETEEIVTKGDPRRWSAISQTAVSCSSAPGSISRSCGLRFLFPSCF